jgi:hypothetical protein
MQPSDLDHADWSKIPEHCREGLKEYLVGGIPVGSFLRAVICNDLADACGRADDINRHHLFNYVQFLYQYAPSPAWGSPEAYNDWVERGGLMGRVAA